MSDRDHAIVPPGQCPGPTNPYRPFLWDEVEQSIPACFARQVASDPEKIAVETSTRQLTYAALNEAANRLANAILQRRGEKAESVAFLLGHGCPQITAAFGILKAGKIYVPLDPTYPPARNAMVLEGAQPGLLVTDNAHRQLAEQLDGGRGRVLNLDDLDRAGDGNDPDLVLSPDRPAIIIYTSGSTGKPMGVVHNHRNILHAVLKYTNHYHISRDDRSVGLYSCAFAGSLMDVFATLLNGATLLPFDLKTQGLAPLGRWLIDKEITLYQSVPTLFRQFVATLDGSEQFPRLRFIRLSGETVTPRDVRLHRKHFLPGCLLAVSLAATEILGIRRYFLDHETPVSGPRVPVGYAMDDTEVLILGEDGKPVEPGCEGEIAVRSPYLALGYWGDPKRTEAAFVAEPERPGVRLYRFGDRGILRPDGCLEYLGRADSQVKVRGHRVEVAEVEAALLSIDDVKEAVVAGKDTATGEQRLVAYVVSATRPGVSVSRLRGLLLETLPDYMIPAAFVMLDALPMTPTGKVDRLALPEPSSTRPTLHTPYVGPADPLQFLLVEAWQECLCVQPVGVGDNFFELGGDSLMAAELNLRVEDLCGRSLPKEALLTAPTVAGQASLLLEHETSPSCPPLVEVQRGDSEHRLFFLHGDYNGGGLYCVPLARQIGKNQPFYALHPHGLSSPLIPPTIEAMAADRLRVLRDFQAEGPYLLGGHCNGGLVAFEMARQLIQLGQRVDFLAVIAPPSVRIGDADHAFPPGPADNLQTIDLSGCPESERSDRLIQAYRDVCTHYVIQRLPTEVLVVLPREDLVQYGEPSRWRGAAKRVSVAEVPGGHLTILTSRYVGALAKLMRDHLATSCPIASPVSVSRNSAKQKPG